MEGCSHCQPVATQEGAAGINFVPSLFYLLPKLLQGLSIGLIQLGISGQGKLFDTIHSVQPSGHGAGQKACGVALGDRQTSQHRGSLNRALIAALQPFNASPCIMEHAP